MKKTLIISAATFAGGVLLLFVLMYQSAPSLMINEYESRYSFDESVTIFEKAVKDAGWKIPIVHDLQKTMKKHDKDVQAVKVFELCHPGHAGKILSRSDERVVTSLMPCRVSIYEKADGRTYISAMNTGLMGRMMKGNVPEVMKDASSASAEFINQIAVN